MKKYIVVILMAVAIFALATAQAGAVPVKDADALTSVFATVGASHVLTVQCKYVADNVDAGDVGFGNVAGNANVVSYNYVVLTYSSNEAGWGVNIWTDSAYDPSPASENTGGLYSAAAGKRVPLVWKSADAPIAGGPAVPDNTITGWTFIKGKKDSNFTAQYTEYCRVVNAFSTISSPISVYIGAMFGLENATPGSYGCTLGFDLYHE